MATKFKGTRLGWKRMIKDETGWKLKHRKGTYSATKIAHYVYDGDRFVIFRYSTKP